MVYKTLFLTVDYMPFKPETYCGVVACDVKGHEVDRVCSAEGMEADFEKLTLNLTGVCNAKILDSSFENFRMESKASVNQRDLHRKPFMS
jgi:hypothetical protein